MKNRALKDVLLYTDAIGSSQFKPVHASVSIVIVIGAGMAGIADAIAFNPPLPHSKVRAIKRLGVGIFEKLVLQFEFAFWRENSDVPCGLLIQDHPILPYWIDLGTDVDNPTLVAHATAEAGVAIAQLDDDAAMALACALLRSVFTKGYVNPVAMHRSNWSNDPFSRGAYLHLTPDSSACDIEALGTPVGRILFAGEATSFQRFGYVDGAYATALREAQRLMVANDYLR